MTAKLAYPIASIDDGVESGYRHYRKEIGAGEPFVSESLLLKWYEIRLLDKSISRARDIAARAFLARQIESMDPPITGHGFVMHHECRSVLLLLVCIWRNTNELWETVYVQADGESEFDPLNGYGSFQPGYCVWEMEAVWHESKARTRYLLSERTNDDRERWLQDSFGGIVPRE